MSMNTKIKILLVDDHPLVLDGINARLSGEVKLEVVGTANNGAEALSQVQTLEPDVVLMDVSMPVMNGFEAAEQLSQQHPHIKVLILSMHDDREYIVRLIQCGAAGYVLKDVSSAELVTAIETVYRGGTYFSSGASETLFKEFSVTTSEPLQPPSQKSPQQPSQISPTSAEPTLTSREKDVLKLLAEGNCNKDIARLLDISVRTVETHRQNIKNKLDIHTPAGLTRYAIDQKLVD